MGLCIMNFDFRLLQFVTRLKSFDDALRTTGEAFCDQRLDPSPCGAVMSIPTGTGDNEEDGDLGDMQSSSFPGR